MRRQDEILDALIEIFKNDGVSADFTISQLAQKVNIGKSTIYEYFKTKDDILRQAICRVFDTSVERIESHPLVDGNFELQFKTELTNLFEAAINSRFLFNLITPSFRKLVPDEHKEDMTKRMKNVSKFYNNRFEKIFTSGVVEGLLNPELLQYNQMVITSLVTGSIFRLGNANLELSKDLIIEEYVDKIFQTVIKITN